MKICSLSMDAVGSYDALDFRLVWPVQSLLRGYVLIHSSVIRSLEEALNCLVNGVQALNTDKVVNGKYKDDSRVTASSGWARPDRWLMLSTNAAHMPKERGRS
jgi:hypothetical protein